MSALKDDTLISLGSETEIFYLGLVATEILCVLCFVVVLVRGFFGSFSFLYV